MRMSKGDQMRHDMVQLDIARRKGRKELPVAIPVNGLLADFIDEKDEDKSQEKASHHSMGRGA